MKSMKNFNSIDLYWKKTNKKDIISMILKQHRVDMSINNNYK